MRTLTPEEDYDQRLEQVKKACAGLTEFFDSIQVVATSHTLDGSQLFSWGEGNYYSRLGAVKDWVIAQKVGCVERASRSEDE